MSKTIYGVLKKFMADKGYDGLFNPEMNCQCFPDSLFHCDTPWITCQFGCLKHFDDDESVIVQAEGK